jgi:hypothetical protein
VSSDSREGGERKRERRRREKEREKEVKDIPLIVSLLKFRYII